MQGTQYATKRSILCRGAFCGPTVLACVGLFKGILLPNKASNDIDAAIIVSSGARDN